VVLFVCLTAACPGAAAAGFEKGTTLSGARVGAGFGTDRFGSQGAHDLVYLKIEYGRVLTDLWSADRWWAGQWTVAGELIAGHQYHPEAAGVAGAAPVVRYVFAGPGDWRPYLLGGMGFVWTDIDGRDLTGKFQFSPNGGAGCYWFVRPSVAVTAEYRFIHYSNGSMRSPNGGLNLHAALVGLTRFH
jgi:opacity protein-like surface antigen